MEATLTPRLARVACQVTAVTKPERGLDWTVDYAVPREKVEAVLGRAPGEDDTFLLGEFSTQRVAFFTAVAYVRMQHALPRKMRDVQ